MTRGIALLAHPDGRLERIETNFPLNLEWLHDTIGGWIEMVRMTPDIIAVVHEEGRLVSLPRNQRYPNLVGPVLLCSDWVDPEDDSQDPDFGPLSEAQLRILEGGGTAPEHTPYMDRTQTIPDSEFGIRVISLNDPPAKGKG